MRGAEFFIYFGVLRYVEINEKFYPKGTSYRAHNEADEEFLQLHQGWCSDSMVTLHCSLISVISP